MSAFDTTVAFLADVLAPLGAISARRMFGGAGVYCDGIIFALIIDDTLYLKTDLTSARAFAAAGMSPFSYETSAGRRSIMSYWQVPKRLFDEPDEFVDWARIALAASAAAPRKARKSARPK